MAPTSSKARHGFDTMVFNGANIAEKMDLSANGTRLLFRDVATITMDTDQRRADEHQRPRRR